MALTARCDIFAAVQDEGINILIKHVMLQRPSLFNYATQRIINNPRLLCVPIRPAPNNAPSFTKVEEIPMPGSGTSIKLDYCMQVTKLAMDFHPGNTNLPSELGNLPAQSLALEVEAYVGVGFPDESPEDILLLSTDLSEMSKSQSPMRILTADKLICFSLKLFGIGSFSILRRGDSMFFVPRLKRLEIVDVTPTGLEDILEKYSRLELDTVILAGLALPLDKLTFELMENVKVKLMPASSVSPNPAIEDNTVKTFINIEV